MTSSQLSEDQIKDIVAQAVEQTFVRLGMQADNPIEMQKDFQHLREWRTSMEAIKRKSMLAVIGFIITGVVTLAWLGMKAVFSTH